MYKPFALMSVLATASVALAAPGFDGKWGISFAQSSRFGVSGEAVFSDGKGNLTLFGGGRASMENPCLNKRMPAVIKSATDSEVVIDIDGNSVLKGCVTETLVLHPGADQTWTGTLGSGYAVTWTRK